MEFVELRVLIEDERIVEGKDHIMFVPELWLYEEGKWTSSKKDNMAREGASHWLRQGEIKVVNGSFTFKSLACFTRWALFFIEMGKVEHSLFMLKELSRDESIPFHAVLDTLCETTEDVLEMPRLIFEELSKIHKGRN